MKTFVFGPTVFWAAFLTGYFVVSPVPAKPGVTCTEFATPSVSASPETFATDPSGLSSDTEPEFTNLPSLGEHEYPKFDLLIDIFKTGGVYRESEMIAKSGEKWLTLSERHGKYSLKWSTAKVRALRSISYPDGQYDARLTFDTLGVPILAVRHLDNLKPGPVTTLYHRPSSEEIERRNLPIEAMKSGSIRRFNLNETRYTLRVSQGLTRDGDTMCVLVLETGKISQVIYQTYDPEIIGELVWVGDIDGDGKLDLYFDELGEEGYFGVDLYLSSNAAPGQLVKLSATHSTPGC